MGSMSVSLGAGSQATIKFSRLLALRSNRFIMRAASSWADSRASFRKAVCEHGSELLGVRAIIRKKVAWQTHWAMRRTGWSSWMQEGTR